MRAITSTDPTTGAVLAEFDEHTDAEVEKKLQAAFEAQRAWRRTAQAERLGTLRDVADVLREHSAELARLITLEMGKPITEALGEVEKCAVTLEHYAEHAPAYLATRTIESNASHSEVVYEPLGVVLAIMPWNYPLWQFVRFLAPALAVGNGALLKHANNVPQCAIAIEKILEEAHVPAGLVSTLLVDSGRVQGLIADPRVAAVTLTGSTAVGRIVAGQAGRALKKQVLELGGSDPFIVLADADVVEASRVAVKARFTNAGQSCVNAKRFIVEDSIADRFVKEFVAGVEGLVVGDPSDPSTTIGPMARSNLRDELHDQVQRTLADGAGVLLTGGSPIPGPGYFFAPTVIDHVSPGDVAFTEETFGPVAVVVRARNANHAVQLANDTEFGLGASIWSSNVPRARELAAQIDAGAVFINGMVASDARLPFGGIKASGYGRELGEAGIHEFTNVKTIWTGPQSA